MMSRLADQGLFRQQALVGGAWVDADDGRAIAVDDQATRKPIGKVPLMATAETRRAIEAANGAWPAWRRLTAQARGAFLLRWHDLIVTHADDIAFLMTMEQGKPLVEAHGEVLYAASFLSWFAAEGERVDGEVMALLIILRSRA